MNLRADVALTDTEDGAVLLDERSGRYFQLNNSGTEILRRLLDGELTNEIARHLTKRFPVSEEQAQTDVTALAEQLLKAGLVTA